MGLTDLTKGKVVGASKVARPDSSPVWKEAFSTAATKTFALNTQGILILTDGNLDFKLKNDDTADVIAVKAGMLIPGNVDVLTGTTTTCTGIVLGF